MELKDEYIEYADSEMHDCKSKKESSIVINCNLEVEIDNRNKTIYLCPGKVQYFIAKVVKSCGEVTIKYKGHYSNEGICGKLGTYKIIENGIAVCTHHKLDPEDIDILCFTATDKCAENHTEFAVIFSYDPCMCCIGHSKDCYK